MSGRVRAKEGHWGGDGEGAPMVIECTSRAGCDLACIAAIGWILRPISKLTGRPRPMFGSNDLNSAIKDKYRTEPAPSFLALSGLQMMHPPYKERFLRMSKPITLFIAAMMPLVAGACTATGSGGAPSMTAGQSRDAAYCQRLVDKYTTYVGSVGGSLGRTSEHCLRADLDAKLAIAECQEGNTSPAIPALERKLRDALVAVPKRAPHPERSSGRRRALNDARSDMA